MARYATQERQYHCEICDQWITEREMTSPEEICDTPGGYCTGCEVTMWMRILIWDGETESDTILMAEYVDGPDGAGRLLLEEQENGRMVRT